MKYLSVLLIVLCLGCSGEHKPQVEIYLLKERKQFTNCIPFFSTTQCKKLNLDPKIDRLTMLANYDTIRNKLVYAGDFEVSKNDLQAEPFVFDDEIEIFSCKGRDNYLRLKKTAYKKIKTLWPKNSYGVQFAITVDGEPVLTGFFWSPISRFRCDTYEIDVYGGDKADNLKDLYIYKGLNTGEFLVENIPYPKEFLNALRATNRLTE